MHIIGSGLAGLLAANMLRHREPTVFEKQMELPNNHSAVLRFRTSVIGDVLNIPFKKVNMIKAPVPWKNPVADALAYSFKNNGVYRSDRSITQGMVSEERYIAPSDLIARMAKNVNVKFGYAYDFSSSRVLNVVGSNPVISTVPMPLLMRLLGYKHELKFSSVPGINIKGTVDNCDAYVSLLVPHPEFCFSRISITGNELIIEIPGIRSINAVDDMELFHAIKLLGLKTTDIKNVNLKVQEYAKISPIPDDERKQFMHWATVNHNIYSLGRFATWRPGLLLDDLVKDIRLIDKWSSQKSKYDVALVS